MTDRTHIGHRALCLFLALLLLMLSLPIGAQGAAIPIPTGDDDTVDVLVIGNSFTTGWPDELCGMLDAAGFKANIYTASHGGTVLQQHWDWLQSGETAYHLQCYGLSDKAAGKGRVTLAECLTEKKWDVISIQEAFMAPAAPDFHEKAYVRSTCALAADMLAYLKTRCPQATLLWHQTWAPEVGTETRSFPSGRGASRSSCTALSAGSETGWSSKTAPISFPPARRFSSRGQAAPAI